MGRSGGSTDRRDRRHARILRAAALCAALLLATAPLAEGPPGPRGPMGGAGCPHCDEPRVGPPGADRGPPRRAERGNGGSDDRRLFHALLANRDQIRRTVVTTHDGVETRTESDAPEVAAMIVRHVRAMKRRLEEGRPIHRRDPLFAELFRHAEAIDMEIVETGRGVWVRETSDDAYVVALIQEHAAVVSAFLKNGHAEVRRNHLPPPREPAAPATTVR